MAQEENTQNSIEMKEDLTNEKPEQVAPDLQKEQVGVTSQDDEGNESLSGDMEDVPINEESAKSDISETVGSPALALKGEDCSQEDAVEHVDDESQVTQSTSTQASGMAQVAALLRKNLLMKIRTPVATFFEFMSPLLMMLILAAAYTLSEVEYREAATYSSLTVDIPGPWLDLAAPALNLLTGESSLLERKRRLSSPFPDRSEPDTLLKEGLLKRKNPQWIEETSRKLMRQVQELAGGVSPRILQESVNASSGNETTTDGGFDDFAASFDLLNDAIRQVRAVLASPVAIPSFETFVGLSNAISQLVGVDDLPQVFSDSSFGRQWGNLLTLGTIHLSPSNEFAQEFGDYLTETYPILFQADSVQVRYHNTEEDALSYINQNLNERAWALLDFEDCSFEEDVYEFKIRQNYTTLPNTNEIVDYASIGLNNGYQLYYLSGFLTLQRTINEFIFTQNECSGDLSSVWSMPMPTAAYSQNPFFQQVGFLLGLTFVMAFLYPTSRLVKSLVEEKETKMRETLFILGLKGVAHWLSWVFSSFLTFLVITITMTLALVNTVLKFSNPWFIFAYILLFSLATIALCFMLSSLFNRAKLAAILSPVVLFATILPRFIFFGVNRYEATTGLIVASLFPATAFALGADIVAAYEYAETGIQTFNAQEGKYSFQTCLIMLSVDTVLYLLLGIYFEKIIPRQYGSPEPFYFFLTPKFWRRLFGSSESEAELKSLDSEKQSGSDPNVEAIDEHTFEARVIVSDLVKQYSKGSEPAVDHLNMRLYEDQITCLLGHNGAGKSTTISCMTGLFPPTSGDCSIYGNSIVKSSQKARASIGYCPQHNTLFSSLTVKEHLELFMRLRGIQPDENLVSLRASEIGLTDFLSVRSSSLSGGNKRKLSVAIALCADPKFLVLDEPTSSMDPHSRRAVWELLRKKRKGRVTLFTSHFMDESEILGDRIAVLKSGKLQCVGSAPFLKHRFGLGYNLTVVSNDSQQLTHLTALVKSIIPGTAQLRHSGNEAVFRIPRGEERKLPALCDAMDTARETVSAYGVQNSSLEEVFLRLAEDEDENQELVSDKSSKGDEETAFASLDCDSVDKSEDLADTPDEEGKLQEILQKSAPLSAIQQIGLIYWKRVVTQRRDRCGLFFLVVVPTLVIALVTCGLDDQPSFCRTRHRIEP